MTERAWRGGHSRRDVPRRRAPRAAPAARSETRFVEGSGKAFNAIPPDDYSYWETIDKLVQQEPAGAGDPGTLGLLASIGTAKGKPFGPDDRMRKILQEAVVVGYATARTISFAPREQEGWAFYPRSAWFNMLFSGGYEFLDPPPQIAAEGVVASRNDGARKLNAKIAFLYPYTGITSAMCMRLTGVSSQSLIAACDSDGQYLDGNRSYRLTLPARGSSRSCACTTRCSRSSTRPGGSARSLPTKPPKRHRAAAPMLRSGSLDETAAATLAWS